jgi:cyanophycinase
MNAHTSGLLALEGGLPFTDGCRFDVALLEAAGADEVVLLPTGSAYEDHRSLSARATTWFGSLGATVRVVPVMTRADGFVGEHIEAVRSARCLYVAGSSSMHLRSVLKDSPTYGALVAAWRGGASLVGSGAGADVFCDPMVDPRGGAFTVGLGLVPGLAVIPRSNTWSAEKIARTVTLAGDGVVVVEVPEATAVIRLPDGAWRAEGAGEVVVHRAGGTGSLADLPPL